MVETPTTLLIESTTTESYEKEDDSNDKEALLEQCEVTLVQETPLTASIRKTLRHVRSVGGSLGRFRGFAFYSVYALLFSQLSVILSFIPFHIGNILVATGLATIRMGWTHASIASPSSLPWFRRIPSIKNFKAIAPITAISALSEELAVGLPIGFAYALGLFENMDIQARGEKNVDPRACLMKIVAVVALGVSWIIVVVIPVTTVLMRIHASLLPEGDETIVMVNRDGPMGIKEAWKSVDWNARMRIYKTLGKGIAIQMGIMLLFSVIVYSELVMFLGPDFSKVMTQLLMV